MQYLVCIDSSAVWCCCRCCGNRAWFSVGTASLRPPRLLHPTGLRVALRVRVSSSSFAPSIDCAEEGGILRCILRGKTGAYCAQIAREGGRLRADCAVSTAISCRFTSTKPPGRQRRTYSRHGRRHKSGRSSAWEVAYCFELS